MKILGAHLCKKVQAECLEKFVHRSTKDHKPNWAVNQHIYRVQFASDADWLAHTWFEITKQGELDKRHKFCESNPTWPDNPELRRQS